jgi:hypothetical protein
MKMMRGLQAQGEFKPRDGYIPTEREVKEQMALRGNLIWYNPKLELITKPVPVPKDDEVLLKVGAAGVCGSDTLCLGADKDNYSKFFAHCKFPVILGHEYSGEVVAVGEKCQTIKVGDLVVAETMNWCGECDACRTGMFNQCERLEEIGWTIDGGYAEYLVAKEKFCFGIGDMLQRYQTKERALEAAALVEPCAVAYNGLFIRGGGFLPGSYVAIHGCGPVGLGAVAEAKAAGASKVFAMDVVPERLEKAKKLGADFVYNPVEVNKNGSSVSEEINAHTHGKGAFMHVETTKNANSTIPEMLKSLAVGGKIVQIGIIPDLTCFDAFVIQTKGASYHGSMGSAGHGIWANVVALAASGQIDMEGMIAARYKLDDAIKAMEHAYSGAPGKVIITPNW